MHNVTNALAAIAAARHVGVTIEQACDSLGRFKGIKRRMELRGEVRGIKVFDDFAHHPTAIAATLDGLRANVGNQKIIAVLEPRSNTMKMGVHKRSLADSLRTADRVLLLEPDGIEWSLNAVCGDLGPKAAMYKSVSDIVKQLVSEATEGDSVLVMSNGGFGGIHQKLLTALKTK